MINVVLIGHRASGKTTFGAKLARELRREFVVIDALIEERTGKSISRIFEEDGIKEFRKLEEQVTLEFSKQAGRVLATGGGAAMNHHLMTELRKTSKIFYLYVDKFELLKRRYQETDKRPLLPDMKSLYREVMDTFLERHLHYKHFAHVVLDGTDLAMAEKIKETLGEPNEALFRQEEKSPPTCEL